MSETDKPLVWLHGEVKSSPFSQSAKLEAGYFLRLLQRGEHVEMPHSRPMPIIGKNCHELRIVDETVTWRLVYFVEADAVVILEVFAKKRTEAPQRVVERCKKRLAKYKE